MGATPKNRFDQSMLAMAVVVPGYERHRDENGSSTQLRPSYARRSGFQLICAEASAFGTNGAPNDEATTAAVTNAQDLHPRLSRSSEFWRLAGRSLAGSRSEQAA
jgi:hypothetical protein